MSIVGIALAAFIGWVAAEMIARQSRDFIVAVAAATIGSIASFIVTIAVLWAFDYLEKELMPDLSILAAGGGTIWGAIAGALIGASNGNRVARRGGR